MTNEERQAAIEWLKGRPITMPGAKKMYDLAIKALEMYVPDMNVGDMISRQAALDALNEQIEQCNKALGSFDISLKDEFAIKVERASLEAYKEQLENLPPIQPTQTNCEYCHTDRDGYVFPLEKNSHAFIDRDKIVLKANGWRGEAKIKYCPICGRRLTDG